MTRIRIDEAGQIEVLSHYLNLPVRDQIALLWGESEAARNASPMAGLPGWEIVTYWDSDDWFDPFVILIKLPRERFRVFRRSMVVDLQFLEPDDVATYGSGPGEELMVRDDRRFPDLDEARRIITSGRNDSSVGEAMLALGQGRQGDDLILLRGQTESEDPVIRYIAYGAAAWFLSEEALELVAGGRDDTEPIIREFATRCEPIGTDEHLKRREWVLGISPGRLRSTG